MIWLMIWCFLQFHNLEFKSQLQYLVKFFLFVDIFCITKKDIHGCFTVSRSYPPCLGCPIFNHLFDKDTYTSLGF